MWKAILSVKKSSMSTNKWMMLLLHRHFQMNQTHRLYTHMFCICTCIMRLIRLVFTWMAHTIQCGNFCTDIKLTTFCSRPSSSKHLYLLDNKQRTVISCHINSQGRYHPGGGEIKRRRKLMIWSTIIIKCVVVVVAAVGVVITTTTSHHSS